MAEVGDRVRVQLALTDGRIETARFAGDSCAICTAAADVAMELATGRERGAAGALTAADVLDVLKADVRPTRMRCVTLPLSVLAAAVAGEGRR